jgi:hypothetical protein
MQWGLTVDEGFRAGEEETSTAPPMRDLKDGDGHARELNDRVLGPLLEKAPTGRLLWLRESVLDRMLGITTYLSSDDRERHDHLRAIAELIEDRPAWELHLWLHQNLMILDDKANAILAVNSIGIATLTFLYSTFDKRTSAVLVAGAAIAAALFLWAIVPLARISFVYWSSTEDFQSPERMVNDLLRLRDRRSAIVRAALVKDAFALCVLGLSFAFAVLLPAATSLLSLAGMVRWPGG